MMLYHFFVCLGFGSLLFSPKPREAQAGNGAEIQSDTIYQTQVILEVVPEKNLINCKFSLFEEGQKISENLSDFPAYFFNNLSFGKNYSWQVELIYDSAKKVAGPYHFYTAPNNLSDTGQMKFSIQSNRYLPASFEDGLIMLDYSNVAVDREGKVVWFLNNNTRRSHDARSRIRPLILTKQGTLLFTSPRGAHESSLQGEMLWKAKHGVGVLPDSPMMYHHDIIKLSNGNYITIGKYRQKRLIPAIHADTVQIEFDVIFEFNPLNEVVWWWGLGHKLDERDIARTFNAKKRANDTKLPVGEINSIYMDEKSDVLYVGIKDMNAILKVNHKNSRIICSYGDKLFSSPKSYANGFFKYQHGGVPDSSGNLVIFNNNGEKEKEKATEIVVISQPKGRDTSIILWNFVCEIDSQTPSKTARLGYALPLSNGNILVCMGFAGRIFEVSRDKKVVWDCIVTEKNARSSEWILGPNYRAYFYKNLYPNYFAITQHLDSVKASVKIKNMGWEDDEYTVFTHDRKDKEIIVAKVKIKAGQELELPLHLKSVLKKPELFIRSANSNQIRRIQFTS